MLFLVFDGPASSRSSSSASDPASELIERRGHVTDTARTHRGRELEILKPNESRPNRGALFDYDPTLRRQAASTRASEPVRCDVDQLWSRARIAIACARRPVRSRIDASS